VQHGMYSERGQVQTEWVKSRTIQLHAHDASQYGCIYVHTARQFHNSPFVMRLGLRVQMEVRKFAGGPGDGEPIVVRTCIAAVPRGYARLEISQLDDPMWGGDGWDT